MREEFHIYPYRRLTDDYDNPENAASNNESPNGPRFKLGSPLRWLTLEGLFFFGICLILSKAELLGGISPFGLAFYAALVSCFRRYLWPMLLALILGQALVNQGLNLGINALVYGIFAFWQLIFPVNFTKRWIVLPVAVFLFTLLLKVGFLFFLDSLLIHKIVAVIVEGLLGAGLVIVYISCLNIIQARKIPNGLSKEESICTVIFCLSLCAGLLDLTYNSISAGNVISRYLIMMAALISGSGTGAALGAVLGILPSMVKINAPVLVGIYAFSGMLAGAMTKWKKIGVSFGFLLGNLILSIYLLDQHTITTAFTETVIAVILLFLSPNKLIMRLRSIPGSKSTAAVGGDYRRYGELFRWRVMDLVRTFEELSFCFTQHAPAAEQSEEEKIQGIFNTVAKGVCEGCTLFAVCWENDFYNTYKNILAAFAQKNSQKSIRPENLPEALTKRCIRVREMAATLSCIYETYTVDRLWRRKITESQSLMAAQLNGISEVLRSTADEIRAEGYFHEELEVGISDSLDKLGFNLENVQVWRETSSGSLEINLRLNSCPGGEPCDQTIVPLLSELMGQPLMAERRSCGKLTGDMNCELRLLPVPVLQIQTGFAQEAKNQRQICGDSCAMFNLPGGKYALILSDGMGVGVKAARESEAAVVLLERLLHAGFKPCLAVQMLNSLLLLRAEEETFATVDLALIDRYSGDTEFLKIGSAPSFIIRNNKVWSVKNQTLPVGIINNLPLEPINEMLQAGDILVMLTDGVLEADPKVVDQEKWLIGILQNNLQGTPEQMAAQILNQVKVTVRNRRADDVSVLVAKVDWEM